MSTLATHTPIETAVVRRIPVHVRSLDLITQAGLAAQLRFEPDLSLVGAEGIDAGTVGIVAVETVTEPATALLRELNLHGCRRIVLVITALANIDLVGTIEQGVCAVVHRSSATPARLAQLAARAAAGEGALPPDVLDRLLKQVSRLRHHVLAPRGLTAAGLSEREVQVLRLVADGFDTQEVARRLCYSERTVKNVLHDITNRFQLRNRTHAVAYALREGLI
jgi:DNA-binding NarL/FixJ family response regulator